MAHLGIGVDGPKDRQVGSDVASAIRQMKMLGAARMPRPDIIVAFERPLDPQKAPPEVALCLEEVDDVGVLRSQLLAWGRVSRPLLLHGVDGRCLFRPRRPGRLCCRYHQKQPLMAHPCC